MATQETEPIPSDINQDNQEKPENEETNSQTKESTKEEPKILGKKTRRNGKKSNNDYCSICQKGGNLLLCDQCNRAFHIECLKLDKNNIPEGKWFCQICTLNNQKNEKKTRDKKGNKPNVTNPKTNIVKQKKLNKPNINSPKTNIEKDKKITHKNEKKKPGRKKKVEDKSNEKTEKQSVSQTYYDNDNENDNENENQNEKVNDENKDTNMNMNEEEEEYYIANSVSKTEILKFLKILLQKEVKTIDEIILTDEIAKILRNTNSIRAINNMINSNKDLLKYKEYWSLLLEKRNEMVNNTKKNIHYPISCKELYSYPERHGLEGKYFNKTEGILYPYCNGKTFTRLINIYDFLLTFSSKIYLNKFTLDEFYSALAVSEKYNTSEISLLSSIHISLSYLLLTELSEIPISDLYNDGEIELLMLKSIIDTKKDDIKKIYNFIHHTWPELIRLFLISKFFNKDFNSDLNFIPILNKVYNVHDVISFNTSLNFDEKLSILEKLVIISYETNFIRYSIKESQDIKTKYKRRERELEDELRDIETKKIEFERHSKLTQPQTRINEIDVKLKELSENKTKGGGDKIRIKLEDEKIELEKMIKEMNDNNTKREELISQIEELQEEYFDIPTIGRTYIGVDGRGFKYFHFTWMPNTLFIRKKKEKNDKNGKYEWRMINNKEILDNDLIDKLCEKGIEELELKDNLLLVSKKMDLKKDKKAKENKVISDEENKEEKKDENTEENKDESKDENIDEKNDKVDENKLNEIIPIDDIFYNQVLKYENTKNPLISGDKKIKPILITEKTNQFEPISDKIKKIEANISKYLSLDNRQWESPQNRSKIKLWIPTIKSVNNFVNILLFFNERIKIPYKSELLSLADSLFGKSATRKIIEEEKSEDEDENDAKNKACPLISNGKFDPFYINRSLQYANRIKLWTKEFETYNLEKVYLEYLRNVKSIPQIIICLNLFEIVVIELNKRRELYKKKGDTLAQELMKNDENKINNENTNKNGMETFTKIEIKKPLVKKKKLIEWNVKCMICHEFGELLCCESCPNVVHLACAKLTKLPDVWRCSNCIDKLKK